MSKTYFFSGSTYTTMFTMPILHQIIRKWVVFGEKKSNLLPNFIDLSLIYNILIFYIFQDDNYKFSISSYLAMLDL